MNCQGANCGRSGAVASELEACAQLWLRPDLLAVTHVWQTDVQKAAFIVAAKGAPETIANLCRLGDADLAAPARAVDAMAAEGLRVLGVARAIQKGSLFPKSHAVLPSCSLGSSVSPTLCGQACPRR